jgi:NADH-quinone oxidoreductase subunit C
MTEDGTGSGASPPGSAPKATTTSRPAERTKTIAPLAGPVDPPPPPHAPVPAFIAALQSTLPDTVQQISFWVGDWTLIVDAARLPEVATYLRDRPDARFNFCSDITATDWPPRGQRFDVIYSLYSVPLRHRVRLKVRTAESASVPTVTGVWPSANWLEREVFDMFGIRFEGHPDLRRILMPDEWQGHPERKDYPLEGPGELLMENPMDWLKLRRSQEIE